MNGFVVQGHIWGYFIYVICAAAAFLTCSQQRVVDFTIPIPLRVDMIELTVDFREHSRLMKEVEACHQTTVSALGHFPSGLLSRLCLELIVL